MHRQRLKFRKHGFAAPHKRRNIGLDRQLNLPFVAHRHSPFRTSFHTLRLTNIDLDARTKSSNPLIVQPMA
jgi:hypothetical protein